jgi:citronellol/citronellal dehydrogenase
MRSDEKRTMVITGGTRGIGLAIAIRCAKEFNIVILGKSQTEDPRLGGTIYTARQEVNDAGGKALALACDVRDDEQVAGALDAAAREFGGIDVLVNNASAIFLAGTAEVPMKRLDLLWQVNMRGTYLCSKLALPFLKRSANPHILTMSPPLNLKPAWFMKGPAYAMSKFGMSMCTLAMAEEFKQFGIGVNSLWPETIINTAAIRNMPGGEELVKHSRNPEIVAEAAFLIVSSLAAQTTGNFFIDAQVLTELAGVTNLDCYAHAPGNSLMLDLFLEDFWRPVR